jgi:hypothetical protein
MMVECAMCVAVAVEASYEVLAVLVSEGDCTSSEDISRMLTMYQPAK